MRAISQVNRRHDSDSLFVDILGDQDEGLAGADSRIEEGIAGLHEIFAAGKSGILELVGLSFGFEALNGFLEGHSPTITAGNAGKTVQLEIAGEVDLYVVLGGVQARCDWEGFQPVGGFCAKHCC